jgi:cytochrome c oxidase subunit III
LSETHSALAHHFDTIEQQREAATLGMWVFLVTEIMFFGGMFTAYVAYRAAYPGAFAAGSRHLDIALGAINTAVLIASSLTMALAVYGSQVGNRKMLVWFLIATILLGLVFLGIKTVEYHDKFEHHLVPGHSFSFPGSKPMNAQLFFSLYFAMTGMHALHMIIGIGLLTVLVVQASRGRFSPEYHSPVEMTGLYWHFVDIVWIFLFPLLYLIDRHTH